MIQQGVQFVESNDKAAAPALSINGSFRYGLGLFSLVYALYGEDLRLLKKVDLPLNPGVSEQVVIGLAFSPTEESIAVCVKTPDGRRLMVVNGANRVMFDVSTPIGYGSCSERLYWSQDGNVLVTGSSSGVRALNIRTAKNCTVASKYAKDYLVVLGFVNGDHFAVAGGYDPGVLRGLFRSTRISIIGADCAESAFWILPDRVYDGVASPFSGLVAVRRRVSGNLYLDTKTGAQTERENRYVAQFADRGKILCLGGLSEISCHDLKSAEPAVTHKFGPRTISSFVAAAQSPKLAALELNSFLIPFSERSRVSLKRWIIWDILKEQAVASLDAIAQKADPQNGWWAGTPYASDLSPSGRRFAVAGDDRLLEYEIVSGSRVQ